MLAVQEINAKGDLTIGGKKVKLAVLGEDDAADPKQIADCGAEVGGCRCGGCGRSPQLRRIDSG